jgi:hypothetical protein
MQLYKLGAVNIAHSNVIISNGLVGYWTFDGGSIDWHTNTVRDMSGQGNTGTLVSMSTSSSPTPGKIGQALNFDGSASVVDMGNVLHPTGATNQGSCRQRPTYHGEVCSRLARDIFWRMKTSCWRAGRMTLTIFDKGKLSALR